MSFYDPNNPNDPNAQSLFGYSPAQDPNNPQQPNPQTVAAEDAAEQSHQPSVNRLHSTINEEKIITSEEQQLATANDSRGIADFRALENQKAELAEKATQEKAALEKKTAEDDIGKDKKSDAQQALTAIGDLVGLQMLNKALHGEGILGAALHRAGVIGDQRDLPTGFFPSEIGIAMTEMPTKARTQQVEQGAGGMVRSLATANS